MSEQNGTRTEAGEMASQTQRLSIRRVTAAAYSSVFSNFSTFIRVASVPFVLTYLIGFVIDLLTAIIVQDFRPGEGYSVIAFFVSFAQWFTMVILATAWHRLVLLGPEVARTKPGIDITPREFNFYIYSLILGLIVWGPYMLGEAALSGIRSPAPGIGPGYLVLLLWPVLGLFLFARLSMVFPGTAIDRPTSIGASWAMTRGASWRLAAIICLCGAPFVLAKIVLPALFSAGIVAGVPGQGETLLYILFASDLALLAYSFLQIGVTAAAISLVYRHIMASYEVSWISETF